MVERQLPKLHTRVRFPSPADFFLVGCSALDACSRKPSELSVSGLIRKQTEHPKANVQDQTPRLRVESRPTFSRLSCDFISMARESEEPFQSDADGLNEF